MYYIAQGDFDSLKDQLQDQFEEMWSFESCGVDFIKRFINTFLSGEVREKGCEGKELSDFICDLVEIDLERWWTAWEETVKRRDTNITAEQLLQIFSRRATLENYLEILSGPIKDDPYWARLIDFEVRTRDRSGDQIGVAYFNQRFDLHLEPSKRDTETVLRIDLENQDFPGRSCMYSVRGCTLVGRQRSFDPANSMVEVRAEGNRIVVADAKEEVMISREQMTIQLLTPSVAIVKNVSGKNAFTVSPDLVLPIQRSAIVEIPFSVKLPGRKLRCYHSSDVNR